MNIAFGHRLGEMVIEMTLLSSSDPKEMAKPNVPVEEMQPALNWHMQSPFQRQKKKFQNPCFRPSWLKYKTLAR